MSELAKERAIVRLAKAPSTIGIIDNHIARVIVQFALQNEQSSFHSTNIMHIKREGRDEEEDDDENEDGNQRCHDNDDEPSDPDPHMPSTLTHTTIDTHNHWQMPKEVGLGAMIAKVLAAISAMSYEQWKSWRRG